MAIIFAALLARACPAGDIDIAFLRASNVVLATENGASTLELKADPRPKAVLRWSPDGEMLSYLVAAQGGGKARLVVIDLAGEIASEAEIRPPTNPPTEGMRFVEDVNWVSKDVIRIGGSINPKNCEVFDLNLKTKRESNWQMGACGTFAYSPDGKHVAYSALEGYGPTEDGLVPIEIDGSPVYRPSPGDGPIITPPAWSPDSSKLAVIQQGEVVASICIVSLTSPAQIVRSPFRGIDPALTWIDGLPVVKAEGGVYAVDGAKGALLPALDPVVDQLVRQSDARRLGEERNEAARDFAKRHGGTDGVPRPTQTASGNNN